MFLISRLLEVNFLTSLFPMNCLGPEVEFLHIGLPVPDTVLVIWFLLCGPKDEKQRAKGREKSFSLGPGAPS